jgi:hypothetical protein
MDLVKAASFGKAFRVRTDVGGGEGGGGEEEEKKKKACNAKTTLLSGKRNKRGREQGNRKFTALKISKL